jgi:Ca2+-transporting ATPase
VRRDGYNELPYERRRSLFAIAFAVLREPMLLLLIAATALYLVLGDLQEAIILFASLAVVVSITLYQEHKTERAIDALRDLSSPRASVIRDGQTCRIAGREVVVGDVIVLAEGDRVPADAIVRDCTSLTVDESLLTGESIPVRKQPDSGAAGEHARPGGDDQPYVYSSTLVVSGRGIAEVKATGPRTEIGRIGKALVTVQPERTPLQKEVGRLASLIGAGALALCGGLTVIYMTLHHDWVEGILAGITLAMALIPEEFPVVMAVFLALGAWRIAQRRVLTRRMPAIEALGATTVLCVDKTGTLTLNHMAVSMIYAEGQYYEVAGGAQAMPTAQQEVLRVATLASQIEPFDPMERALVELGERALAEPAAREWALAREYPLTPARLAVTRVGRLAGQAELIVASKGAPETIAALCQFDGAQLSELHAQVIVMADRGLRVLGVARASYDGDELPDDPGLYDFAFLGLIGLADPIRPTVPDAIRECYSAELRVVMITGDYPQTARAIARQIGLRQTETCITGVELDGLSDAELRERVGTTAIFARVVPAQKLRLVQAFKARGEIVTMTGDGVNDAPALKAAHIGVAMGGRGTDVAREAASLVLLDDDFSSIVAAVRLGRRVYTNLRASIAYLLAVHVPIAGMSLLPVLLGMPLVLLPVHIVFLEFIIDPACSIVFEAEPEAPDVMRRPPRNPNEPGLSWRVIATSMVEGLSVLVIVFAIFVFDLNRFHNPAEARALAFTTLVIANLALILSNRSLTRPIYATLRRPNRALWWVLGGTVAALALAIFVPFLRNLFQFGPLHADDLVLTLVAGLASIAWFEVFKVFRRYRRARNASV